MPVVRAGGIGVSWPGRAIKNGTHGRELHGGIQICRGMSPRGKPVRLRVRFGESVSEAMTQPNVRGEELEPFRDKAGVVYEHFVEKGYFTWEEIEEAQRVARGEAR